MSVQTGFVTVKVFENQPVEAGKLPKIDSGSLKVIPKTRLSTDDESLIIGNTETYKIKDGVLTDGDIELPLGNYRFVLASKTSTFKFDSSVTDEHTESNPLNLALGVSPELIYPNVSYLKIPSGVPENRALVVNDGVLDAVDLEAIKGPKGDSPLPPTFSVGEVSTLPEGSEATVKLTGSNHNYVLDFGVPAGAKGDQGGAGTESTVKDTGWIDLKPFARFADNIDTTKNTIEYLMVRRISNTVSVYFRGRLTQRTILLSRDVVGFSSVFLDLDPSPGVRAGEVHVSTNSVTVLGVNTNGSTVNVIRYTYVTADPWPDVLPGQPI